MALPILDGNQSATTLSTILSGGEHTPAHTVVSLGSTAISNITSAVSGSVVSVSNFPASQTVAGTVTANLNTIGLHGQTPNTFIADDGSGEINYGVQLGYFSVADDSYKLVKDTQPLPIYGTVTVSSLPASTVTVSSLPVISGTVTVGNSVTIGSLPTLTPQLPRVTFIDGSGSVTTANTAVTVFASSSTRSYLLVQVTTGSAFVNVGATATTVNGISLTAGQGYAWETTIPQGPVSLISTTTSSRYVAKQA